MPYSDANSLSVLISLAASSATFALNIALCRLRFAVILRPLIYCFSKGRVLLISCPVLANHYNALVWGGVLGTYGLFDVVAAWFVGEL